MIFVLVWDYTVLLSNNNHIATVKNSAGDVSLVLYSNPRSLRKNMRSSLVHGLGLQLQTKGPGSAQDPSCHT